MKKYFAVFGMVIVALSMNSNVFAAKSVSSKPSTTTITKTETKPAMQENVLLANNNVIIDGIAQQIEVTFEAVSSETAQAALNNAAILVSPNAKVLNIMDVKLPTSFTKATIAFRVPGVAVGQVIKVLHQKADGTWEVITPDHIDNGVVIATFTSLSPVAFVVDTEASTAALTTAAVGSATIKSPKTGESNRMFFVEILAVLCLMGTVVFTRRYYFNK